MKSKFDYTPLVSQEYVVIDIETTGFAPDKGGRIIEIGAVRINTEGEVLDSYNSFFNPRMKIPKKITGLTGITDDMVKEGPSIYKELPKLDKFIGITPVVCHNLNFDWNRFLLPLFREIGIIKRNVTLDSLKLARLTFPDEETYKLLDCCRYCDITLQVAHRAYDDAYMTAMCLLKMRELNQEKFSSLSLLPQEENIVTAKNVDIRSVKYWEGHGYHRHYVNLFYNEEFLKLYFDIDDEAWKLNQEYDEEIFGDRLDWNIIEDSILEYTNTKSIKELKEWR